MRKRPWNGPRRHPWPPENYDDYELGLFDAREKARREDGRVTHEAWVRMPWIKRHLIENPEIRYWKRRRDNDNRRDQRRTHRHLRAEKMSQGDRHDVAAFYRAVRSSRVVICVYCRLAVLGRKAHIDHVIPLARGGEHKRANLAAACETCNRRKRALTGDEFRALLEAESRSRSTQEVHSL